MKSLRTGLGVVMLLLATAISAFAQVHQLSTDLVAPGKIDLSIKVNNTAVDNSEQALVRFGIVKNVEGQVYQGFVPGVTYLGIKANLLTSSHYKLVGGIYKYSTREEIVAPYLLGGTQVLGFDVFAGGIFYKERFEPHVGISRALNPKVSVGVQYQGSDNEYLSTFVAAKINNTAAIKGTLYFKDLSNVRVYPGAELIFHLR